MRSVILQSMMTWQAAARPCPHPDDASKAFGIHLEEVHELLQAIKLDPQHEYLRVDASALVHALAETLKTSKAKVVDMDRIEVLDALADQTVTAAGIAHNNRMDFIEACYRVDQSNWSKFENGQPLFSVNGKVIKGPSYKPVDLRGLV